MRTALRLWRNRGAIGSVILYVRENTTIALLAAVCRLANIPVALEICEWPISFTDGSRIKKLQSYLFSYHALRFANAAIVISHFLRARVREFEQRTGKRRPSIIVPILVTASEYQSTIDYNPAGPLLFAGILDHIEIVEFLIEVMARLRARGETRKLLIVGRSGKATMERLKGKVKKEGLEETIEFLGFVSYEKLKQRYAEASILLAPLPSGIRSEARFPTKIGEYAACGRPIVTTAVGDIPRYFENGKTAMLVAPDDHDGYTEAILSLLKDPRKARAIAETVKVLTDTAFNPAVEGKRMVEFLAGL